MFAGGDAPLGYTKAATEKNTIPIYSNGVGDKALYGFTDKGRVTNDAVTISARGTIGYTEVRKAPFFPIVRLIVAIPDTKRVTLEYLQVALQAARFSGNGNSIQQLTIPMIEGASIPLPPLEVQKEISDTLAEEAKIVVANRTLIKMYELKIARILENI